MQGISIGLRVAYEFAAAEALYGAHEFVEPEHFFIGVCKVGNLTGAVDWDRSQLPADARASFQSEMEGIVETIASLPGCQ